MKYSKKLVFMTILIAIALIASACSSSDSKDESSDKKGGSGNSKDKQELSLIETAEIPTGDPALATDQASFLVLGQTMEGLYALDANDKPVPAIADGEPEVSKDGKEYTFKIKKDAKWSNGDPVTANDFVYAWRRVVDPDTGSEYAYMFSDIVKNAEDIMNKKAKPEDLGVEATDDHTLKVTLEHPVPYFNSLLAFGTYLPMNEKFTEEKGNKYGTNSDNMLANGPFVLKDWNGSGLTWHYVKNEHYYDKDKVSLDKVNVQVAKTPNTAVNLYNTGKADRTGALSAEYAKQYQNNKEAATFEEGSSWYLKFNQERDGKATPLANKNIRKALAMAFDKKGYVDTVLSNGSVPSDGYVPQGLSKGPKSNEDFRKESGDLMSYDVEKAKDYWKKGLKELGVKELSLDYLSDDTETAKKTAEYFKSQLETNLEGLKLNLTNMPFKVRLDKTVKQDYDVVMHGWGPDYLDPMTFLDLYVTDGTNNNASYSNPEYDKLIKDAKVKYANDPEKRWDTMLKAEKLLIQEDTAIAPIYQRGRLTLVKPYVKNFDEHLFGPDYTLKNTKIEK